VRFSDEELKHQALFPRIDAMLSEVLPDGYRFDSLNIVMYLLHDYTSFLDASR
jgi:hypothetical protein